MGVKVERSAKPAGYDSRRRKGFRSPDSRDGIKTVECGISHDYVWNKRRRFDPFGFIRTVLLIFFIYLFFSSPESRRELESRDVMVRARQTLKIDDA